MNYHLRKELIPIAAVVAVICFLIWPGVTLGVLVLISASTVLLKL